MRHLNPSTLAMIVTMSLLVVLVALTFVSCEERAGLSTRNARAAISAVPSAPATVALPNFTELVKKQGPAVINLSTTRKVRRGFDVPAFPEFPGLAPDDPFYEFFRRFSPGDQFPREFQSQSLGSGFIISADGYILTNAHVVADADEVMVRLTDQREFKAKVAGADRRSDIAVLKISARDLPFVSIGDSAKLEVGEWVVAIGSPFGFTNSVSQGIVSAKGRSLPGENVVPFIQTDVPINPGNSGGPLFNMNGEVVGVNSQIYSRSGGYMGLSFAIPIDLAMKVKDELLKHGTVRRGRLGITIQNVTPEHARSFDLKKPGGALVSSVEKDGPADKAGLEIGDIILRLDGKELASADDLAHTVADTAPDSSAKLQVWRNGAVREITVKLGEADSEQPVPSPQGKGVKPDQLGFALRELSQRERRELHTDGHLLVEEVSGVAAESGVHPGDIIIAINSVRISSIRQLRAELNRFGKRAAVLVQREGNMIFIPLRFQDE